MSEINIILKRNEDGSEFVEIENQFGRSIAIGTVSAVNDEGYYKITIKTEDLPPRVWGRGAVVPAGVLVMDMDGDRHPEPDDNEVPWGNYLGFVVEIPSLDQLQTIVDTARSQGAVITDDESDI